MFELLGAQGLLEEGETSVGNRKATVKLATGHIDIESLSNRESSVIRSDRNNDSSSHLLKPLEGILGEVVPLGMSQDILGQGWENGLEVSALGGSHGEYAVKRQ